MTAAPSAISPSPWPAAAYTGLFAPALATSFACTYGGAAIRLWNVRLGIDETGSPTGRLSASYSPSEAGYLLSASVRNPLQMLEVTTGYGDQAKARIFYGTITTLESDMFGGGTLEAVSAEYLLDTFPASATTYTVGSGETAFKDPMTDIYDSHTYYGAPLRVLQIGSLTNPSSYTAFRQQSLQATDTLLDFLIATANSLGQWLRGDQRGRANTGFLWGGVGFPPASSGAWDVSKLILSDRWDSGTAIDLTPITTKWVYRESTDDYADQLTITARYKSGGSEVTKTAKYSGAGASIVTPPLTRSIDVQYRPGTAFTAGTDRTAQRWADSYSFRRWTLTANCRAAWWLEPGHQATIAGHTGTITKLEFQIDAGTMTVTLRPTTTWTPA